MIKQVVWWVAGAGLFVLSGCPGIEQCDKGQPGCLDGPAVRGECLFDLVPDDQNLCAEPGPGVGRADAGEDDAGGDDAGTPRPCDCARPELCTPNAGECVDYCAAPDIEPGSVPLPEFLDCDEPEAFDEICVRSCEILCRYYENYCGSDAACPAGYCESFAVIAECDEACGEEDDPEDCLRGGCNNLLFAGCGEVACPDDTAPSCGDVSCTNDCTFAGDGECDDGDLQSAQYAGCEWGTDCADCGPRRGSAPELQPYGGSCVGNANCVGFAARPNGVPDLARTEAWCLNVSGQPEALMQCLPDCSRGQACPAGYTCQLVTFSGEELEQGEYTSQSCVPDVCE